MLWKAEHVSIHYLSFKRATSVCHISFYDRASLQKSFFFFFSRRITTPHLICSLMQTGNEMQTRFSQLSVTFLYQLLKVKQ